MNDDRSSEEQLTDIIYANTDMSLWDSGIVAYHLIADKERVIEIMNPTPTEPPDNMWHAATMTRQMYRAYLDAGFTEEQAFELVKIIAASGQAGGN